jgi:hypothetical protein
MVCGGGGGVWGGGGAGGNTRRGCSIGKGSDTNKVVH